jgi:hypothetical protein
LAAPHKAVTGTQVAASRYQQANGQVGHILCQRAQGGSDSHTAAAAISQVHGIGADAVDRHDFDMGQLRQHLLRDARVTAGDHCLHGGPLFA